MSNYTTQERANGIDVLMGGFPVLWIRREYFPAVLAALLRDAGAAEVYLETDTEGEIGMIPEPPDELYEMWDEAGGPFDAYVVPKEGARL